MTSVFLRVINTPPRGVSKAVMEMALDQSVEWKKSIYSTLKRPEFTGKLGTRARTCVQEFLKLLDYYSDAVISRTADYSVTHREVNRRHWLRGVSSPSPAEKKRRRRHAPKR